MANNEKKVTWITVLTGLLGSGIFLAILTWIAGLGWDIVAILIYILVWGISAFLAWCPVHLIKQSSLVLTSDASLARVPLIPKKWKTIGFWSCCVCLLMLFPLTLTNLWTQYLFPLVRMENFEGSRLTGGSGDKFVHRVTPSLWSADKKETPAYSALEFTVAKSSSTSMRLREIRVKSQPQLGTPGMAISGTYPANVAGVNRFLANLPSEPGTTKAQMIFDNQLTAGILRLQDEQGFALIHIDFMAEKAGYYLVSVEAVLCDDFGIRARTVCSNSPQHILIYAREESPVSKPGAQPPEAIRVTND